MTRFLARLIDFVLLSIVVWLVVSVVILGALMGTSGGFGLTVTDNWAANAVSAVLTALLYLAYFALMESSQGKTLGKMVMSLEVRGASGGRPTMAEALKRNAFMALGILGIIPFIGGFVGSVAQLAAMVAIAVTVSNDTLRRQGWHDKFAGGTTVVRTA